MPTPMAHALGGLAAALMADSAFRRQQLSPALLVAASAAAVAPDLDLLLGSHRTYTHSIGAVIVVGVATLIAFRGRVVSATRAAVILMAGYGSHIVLDWLGKDSSVPPGLTIAWPFSSADYVSGWNVFAEVSRRYWLPEEFVCGNLLAFAREMLILVPVLLFAWILWSGRTLHGSNALR